MHPSRCPIGSRNSAEASNLETPVSLALRSDDAVIHALVSSIGGNPPYVDDPKAILPSVPLVGAGPFAFTLPDLDEGRYQLCGTIRFRIDDRFEREPYCKTIKVTAG